MEYLLLFWYLLPSLAVVVLASAMLTVIMMTIL